MKEAVPYLRVSGKGQVDGTGFDRQLETCQKRAELEGILLREEVREEGVSGAKDLGDRPALSKLLESLSDDPDCNTIILERADRLARDLIISELILKECRDLGIQVIEAESGRELTADDSDDPTSRLVRQILAAVAEFDRNSIVLKLRKARQRKKAAGTGGKEGVKPYGDQPGEETGLKLIRQLHAAGKGSQTIAAILNRKSIPTRRGGCWQRSSVYRITSRLSKHRVQ